MLLNLDNDFGGGEGVQTPHLRRRFVGSEQGPVSIAGTFPFLRLFLKRYAVRSQDL